MRTKNKKIVALFISMIMLLSSVTGLAEIQAVDPADGVTKNILKAGTTEDNMPKLELVYMEKSGSTFVEKELENAEALHKPASGNAPFFYVGLKMSNFDRFVDNDTGIRILTAMMVYNNDYIAPIEDKNGGSVTVTSANDFRDAIYRNLQAVPTSYVNKTGEVYDDDLGENIDKNAYPEIRFTAQANGDTSTIYTDDTKSALRGLQVNFTADSKFRDQMSQFKFDNDYLMIVRCRVKANAPAGTKVFGISQKDSTTITFDNNKNYGYGLATALEKYLVLDDSKLNIFPAGKINVSIKTQVGETETTLTDKVSAEETDTTVKFKDIKGKLTNPTAPSGKYFVGWSSASDSTTALTDNDTISITTDGTDKSVKVYAIFADDGVATITGVSGATDSSAVYGKTIPFVGTMTVDGTMQSGVALSKVKIGTNGLKLYRQTATGWEEVTAATTYNVGDNVFTVATGVPGTAGVVQLKTSANATTFKVSAAKKTLTLTFAATSTGSTNKEYDGTATASGITPSYPDNAKVDASDELPAIGTINYTYTGTNAANVGNNKDIKAAFAGTAPNNTKYVLALPANGATGVKGNITAKAITATLTVPTDKVYNGQTQKAVTANVTGATLTADTDYTITYKKSGADADPKNADTYDVAFNLTNSNYSIASAPAGTYTIGKKPLNPTKVVVSVSQDLNATAPYSFTELPAVLTGAQIATGDTVTVKVSGTVAADDIKGSGEKDLTGTPTYVVSNDNYVIGTVGAVKADVSALPIASWKATVTGGASYKAANTDKNNETYLTTGVLTDGTVLPQKATITYDSPAKEKEVELVWTADEGNSYNAKSGTYTYTAALKNAETGINTTSLQMPTLTVTVEASKPTNPTFEAISANVGDTKTLPATTGTVTVDGKSVDYTITWKDASGNTITSVTVADTNPITVTGTIAYDSNATWLTAPDSNEVTVTITAGQIEISSIDPVADITADIKTDDTEAKIEAKLPATITLKEANDTAHEVAVTWTKTSTDPWAATGGTYKYTPVLSTSDQAKYKLATGVELPEVTITAAPIELEIPNDTFAAKTIAKSETPAADYADLGLTTEGDIDVDGTTVHFTVDWTATPLTDLDISKGGQSKEFVGTLTFTNAPDWLTLPDGTDPTAKTLEVKQTISTPADNKATGWKEAINADNKISAANANNTKEYLVDAIPTELPATATALDADGKPYEVTLTWELAEGTQYAAQAGVYEYTAKPSSTDIDVTDLTDLTAKITVVAVKANFDPTIFNPLTVKKKADNSSFKTLGLITEGIATLTVEDESLASELNGKEVKYTVDWSPASTSLDTSKSGSQIFDGTVKFTGAPDWVTLPTETTGQKTVKVQGGGSGGGGVASYAVVFSAGAHGKIVSGKSSLSVTSGQVIKELPVVEANEGYKFIGWSQDGGKTIINLADNPIKKATNFTAVYEEDVKPTPTPVVIPPEFTKPYASGYDGDIFLPDNNITRAELATMIARLMYGDELPDGVYRASFSDIPSDAWYSKYVGYLENFGILDGYDEDGIMVFKPEQTITRAEMATVITRAQRFAVDSADNTFWDVDADYWAAGYIATLASRNIITGYADGSFAPTNPLTRAEAVVIINRLLDPSTAIVTFMPIDISGHWAENEIILAVNERQIDGTGVEVAPEQEETPAPEATPEAEAEETAEPTATPAA